MNEPPLETGLDALATIWRPDGLLLLAEAVQGFGLSKFGEDWNGEEVFLELEEPKTVVANAGTIGVLLAADRYFRIERNPPDLPDSLANVRNVGPPWKTGPNTNISDIDLGEGSPGARNPEPPKPTPPEWFLHVPKKPTESFETEEEAKKAYDAEFKAEVSARMAAIEAHNEALPRVLEAYRRLDVAVSEMRSALNGGTVTGANHNLDTGDTVPMKRKFWASELVLPFFRLPGMLNANRAVLERKTAIEMAPSPETKGYRTRVRFVVLKESLDQFQRDYSTPPDRAPKLYSISSLETWYEKRVKKWPKDKPSPSEADDFKDAKQCFGGNVTREAVRVTRRAKAPEDWKRSLPKTRSP